MKKGKIINETQDIKNINEYLTNRLNLLPEEHKRFDFPHIYKVGISHELMDLRDNIISKYTANDNSK